MKLRKENKLAIGIISLIIVFAVSALLLNQLMSGTVFNFGKAQAVKIKARDFVPADTNQQFIKDNTRLIVVEDFHANRLNNNRSIHIFLPPSYYKETVKKYPVLYVQDGKSVFDLSDWSKESLNMHTTADRLISENKIKELIIVGIDNIGEMRTSEYAHWDGTDMGKPVSGKGLLYEDFVINDVMPFINKNFRTLSDRENTALMGASIGGLATFNIGYRNPEKFSKLAMMSPYLGWGDGKLYQMLNEGDYKGKKDIKMWIDAGSKEDGFINMAAEGILALLNNGYKYLDEVVAYEAPDGEHSERFWAERVEPVLIYFYGSIGKPKSIELFTNNKISMSDKQIKRINAVIKYDSGFKFTDLFGTVDVKNPKLLKIEGLGSGLIPLAEGTTNITYSSVPGLKADAEITITK